MTTHKYLTILSIALIGTGATIGTTLGVSDFTRVHSTQPAVGITRSVEVSTSTSAAQPSAQGVPRHISIPNLNIEVPVQDGYYDIKTGKWTLSEEAAFFATPTDIANSKQGNTFIYGHNSNRIFGKLLQIKPGTQATVVADTGAQFTYTFTSTKAVDPTDTGVLQYSGTPRLMLQTCSGSWNQTRQIFYFNLTSYKQ
jgi:LPXTG-site transpeptidase (sortase) family protein